MSAMEIQKGLVVQGEALPAASPEEPVGVQEEPQVPDTPGHRSLSQWMTVLRSQVSEALARDDEAQGKLMALQE
eukprot:1786512-Prorocentrum_lima.AAC.1